MAFVWAKDHLIASALFLLAVATLPLTGCSSKENEASVDDDRDTSGDTSTTTDSATDGKAPLTPCEGQTCSGHGTCVETGMTATCSCAEGYTTQGLSCARQCGRPAKEKCFAGDGLPPGDDLVADLRVTRTQGVAPLYVFFDATNTTSTQTERSFHELGYCWNFDDGDAGCFATTGRSKNEAFGPLAGHVFEAPGRYEVRLTVRDQAQHEDTKTVTIVVEDPNEVFAGANTVCVSGVGAFDGCPDGATHVTQNTLADVQNHVKTGRRILLHRGEEFSGSLKLLEKGPGIIGAFPGEGARPRILTDGNGFNVHNPQGTSIAVDWRIMDIEVDCRAGDATSGVKVEFSPEEMVHLLFLRLFVHDGAGGIRFEGNAVALQDCEVTRLTGGAGGNLLYGEATDLFIAGSTFNDSTGGEHAMRLTHVVRGVISNNYIGMVPAPRLAIKLHAPDFSTDPRYTEFVNISDNIIVGDGGQRWMVDFGPQNEVIDQRVRNILFESNLIKASDDVYISILALGDEITIRENLFTRPSAKGWTAIDSRSRGIAPDPNHIFVYGNTTVTTTGAVDFCGFGDEVQTFTVANNFLVSPEPGSVFEAPVSGGTAEGNIIGMGNEIIAHPPQEWEDFRPSESSSAVGAASPMHQWFFDFARDDRPHTASAGALEPSF